MVGIISRWPGNGGAGIASQAGATRNCSMPELIDLLPDLAVLPMAMPHAYAFN